MSSWPTISGTLRHFVRIYGRHLAFIVLVLAIVWTGIGYLLWHDRAAAENQAVADTTNLVHAFSENIARTIETVDQTTRYLRDVYLHDRSGFLSWSWTGDPPVLADPQVQVALADRDGNILWSSLQRAPAGVSIADREHFQVQRNSTSDDLFISHPVLGRVSRKWTIQFSRKLLDQNGRFSGVVVVSIDPHYLSNFYQSISIGNGSIMLAKMDGTILARAPGDEVFAGTGLPPDMQIQLSHGASTGSYRAISGIDHVDRISSFRHLDRYPLILAVGLATEDVFAPFERNRRLYLLAGLLVSAAGLVGAIILSHQRRELIDSRQALTTTLENMSQGVAMIDANGVIAVLNRKAITMLGLPREWLEKKPMFQQVVDWQFEHGEFATQDPGHPTIGRTFRPRGMERRFGSYERTRPNGMVLEVRTQVLPDGGFIRTFTDITERRQTQAALAAAQARAAHAERLQALGQLAGGIAHDFNNVLQVVQGSASLIVKRAADPEGLQRLAGAIDDAAERGASITRRLLAFARRGELRAEPVDVLAVLCGLKEVLNHTLGSTIKVELCVDAHLPPLLADRGQLETVLVNLATNARDAMPAGGTLTFAATLAAIDRATPDLRPGRYVCLTASDTGVGMDQATAERSTEPFFSTKPVGRGTGLGLSMTRGFVEQSGGAISIDSSPGCGTTIHLWLPATDAATDVAAAAGAAEARSMAPTDSGHNILLVDDEDLVRDSLTQSLEECGYVVTAAPGGQDALKFLASGMDVSIMITDLAMPGLDGLNLIREARTLRPNLPAILLTGYAGPGSELAVSGLLRGPFCLVRKPVTVAHLSDRIEALLAVSVPRQR
jgi:PAS domain S-box-containing protein